MLAGLVLAACSSPPSSTSSPEKGVTDLAVTLAPVEQRLLERSVSASGIIAPWEEIQLGVELNGVRVTALHVDVGQVVKKGEILLELDHRVLDSELRQAQAAYDAAESNVALAKISLSRGEDLSKNKLISASALDDLRAKLIQTEAHRTTTKAQVEAAQLRRDFAVLRAPDDGVISKRLIQPGQVITAGMELLRVIRQNRLEWRAELTESDLMRMKIGAEAEIAAPDGSVIPGKVRTMAPSINLSTRTATVYVDLSDSTSLKAGVFAEGKIVIGTSSALLIPAAAVIKRDGYAYAFTVDEKNIAHRIRIRTGDAEGEFIDVIDGVQAGDKVVAQGTGFLSDGDPVRLVNPKAIP